MGCSELPDHGYILHRALQSRSIRGTCVYILIAIGCGVSVEHVNGMFSLLHGGPVGANELLKAVHIHVQGYVVESSS